MGSVAGLVDGCVVVLPRSWDALGAFGPLGVGFWGAHPVIRNVIIKHRALHASHGQNCGAFIVTLLNKW